MSHPPGMSFAVASASLADLLTEARMAFVDLASDHQTQRGATQSVNNVALTWLAPQQFDEDRLPWSRADIDWYLDHFVAAQPLNDPLMPSPGGLVFPYTYAGRARYWDGGWGALVVLIETLLDLGVRLDRAQREQGYFTNLVALLGERLHVQTVLSLFSLYPPALLMPFMRQPDLVRAIAAGWRRDQLAAAIDGMRTNSHSRRAVVASLTYPQLEEELIPQMGNPPYQLFQMLPDDASVPLRSIHEHRSLDLTSAAPLDFAHDLAWLQEASTALGRTVGDITIIAHNLHERASRDETIEAWLSRVTDGYRTGQGLAANLVRTEPYAANVARIHARWSTE